MRSPLMRVNEVFWDRRRISLEPRDSRKLLDECVKRALGVAPSDYQHLIEMWPLSAERSATARLRGLSGCAGPALHHCDLWTGRDSHAGARAGPGGGIRRRDAAVLGGQAGQGKDACVVAVEAAKVLVLNPSESGVDGEIIELATVDKLSSRRTWRFDSGRKSIPAHGFHVSDSLSRRERPRRGDAKNCFRWMTGTGVTRRVTLIARFT